MKERYLEIKMEPIQNNSKKKTYGHFNERGNLDAFHGSSILSKVMI